MLDLTKWKGTIEVDGVVAKPNSLVFRDGMVIMLHTPKQTTSEVGNATDNSVVYKVTVRQYMTKPSSPSFDFMKKFNNDIPMPLRTMVGCVDKETKGMYHMILRGDILSEKTMFCMRCGKPITNPVSQYFGMGPECGGHNYVNPFNTEDELKEAVENYRKQLNNIKWEGWIIKSAIIEMTEVELCVN